VSRLRPGKGHWFLGARGCALQPQLGVPVSRSRVARPKGCLDTGAGAVACATGAPAYDGHERALVTLARSTRDTRILAFRLLAGNKLGSDPFRPVQQLLPVPATVSRQAIAGEQITARVRRLGNRPRCEHFPAVNQSAVHCAWKLLRQ
jgi:hypothetical protein